MSLIKNRNHLGSKGREAVMMISLLLIIPQLTGILLNYTMQDGIASPIPVVVADYDNSEHSRSLVEFIDENETLSFAGYLKTDEDVKRAIENQNAGTGIIIREGFGDTLLSPNEDPFLHIYYDGTNLFTSSGAKMAMAEILGTMRGAYMAGIYEGKLEKQETAAINMAQPIDATYRTLYNPGRDYRYFLVPGFVCSIIQIGIVVLGVQRAKDGARGILSTLFKVFRVGIAGSLSIFLYLWVQHNIFGGPMRGDLAAIVLTTLLFSCCIGAFGYIIGRIIKDRTFSIQVACFIIIPSVVVGGYTFPLGAMPDFFTLIRVLIPFSYYGSSIRSLMVKPLTLDHVIGDIRYYCIFLCIECLILALLHLIGKGSLKSIAEEELYEVV